MNKKERIKKTLVNSRERERVQYVVCRLMATYCTARGWVDAMVLTPIELVELHRL